MADIMLSAVNLPFWQQLPLDLFRLEHGTFDAGSLVVPAATRLFHFGDAGEADADAAGHRRFERDLTGNVRSQCDLGHGFHHRLRPAAYDPRPAVMLGQDLLKQVRNQSMMP